MIFMISEKADVSSALDSTLCEDDFSFIYEIQRCIDIIRRESYKRIALQFPDCLMGDSYRVLELLKCSAEESSLGDSEFFILGDTSYGSCCVDEVAAEHVEADHIIHYGSSCLSPPSRIPVTYVFGHLEMDVQACVDEICRLCERESGAGVVVFYDVRYSYRIDEVKGLVGDLIANGSLTFSELRIPEGAASQGKPHEEEKEMETMVSGCVRNGRVFKEPEGDRVIAFYVGDEGLGLNNLMMTYNQYKFYSFNPKTNAFREENIGVNKQLMKRFLMVQKVKDAEIVGIVCGTLGMKDYLKVINGLKQMLNQAGKKTYTFVIGETECCQISKFYGN